jgi:dihydrofolate synthase/folylpolyglutamate synthase
MTYEEAVAYLESLIDYERTPAGAAASRLWNLDRMRQMLRAVGDPHLQMECVHIAGTKGKGSTAAISESILRAAGYRTGLYTSPHLVSFRERIRLDGALISEEDTAALVGEIRPVIEALRNGEVGPPSFFEAYTLLALLHFARRGVKLAVLETGLGGRLDATNVVTPLACALARIGLDHTVELGDTIAAIAREKAGIIKEGVSVISAAQETEAMEVFQEVCLERNAQLFVIGGDGGPSVSVAHSDHERQVFTVHGIRGIYADLECPLLGRHQAENAALAVGLVELLAAHDIEADEEAVRAGVASVRWPGRLQIARRRPCVVLDGAHDELSALALAASLQSLFSGRRIILVLGVQQDKDVGAIARVLCPLADRVMATASSSPRAVAAEELQQTVFPLCKHSSAYTPVSLAVREAIGAAKARDVVVITGSLYTVGEAMQALAIAPE